MPGKNKTLVTGSKKGLGKFLASRYNGIGLTRENSADVLMKNASEQFGHIIHCANDDQSPELLKNVLQLKHRHFVFISSSDVYPDNGAFHTESEALDPLAARSPYAKRKIECEKLVEYGSLNPVIIRPVSLLGPSECGRSLHCLLTDAHPVLSLTANSEWNFVGYEDVLDCIQAQIETKQIGPVNLARAQNVRVEEIAAYLGKSPNYGSFCYRVGHLGNQKAEKTNSRLTESSLTFFRKWHEGRI